MGERRARWKEKSPVSTEDGLQIVANCSLADAPKLDVTVVPGGLGQQDLMDDQQVLGFLRTQAESARYIVSVCTGSLLLGAAGLLTGYRATCHWMYLHLLEQLGAIPTAERVVVDRNRITGAGVSAGIDRALQLVSLLRGQEAAQAIQLRIAKESPGLARKQTKGVGEDYNRSEMGSCEPNRPGSFGIRPARMLPAPIESGYLWILR